MENWLTPSELLSYQGKKTKEQKNNKGQWERKQKKRPQRVKCVHKPMKKKKTFFVMQFQQNKVETEAQKNYKNTQDCCLHKNEKQSKHLAKLVSLGKNQFW